MCTLPRLNLRGGVIAGVVLGNLSKPIKDGGSFLVKTFIKVRYNKVGGEIWPKMNFFLFK